MGVYSYLIGAGLGRTRDHNMPAGAILNHPRNTIAHVPPRAAFGSDTLIQVYDAEAQWKR